MREAPKARLYTSLGQRPRSPAQNRAGLKARLISPSVAGKTGMRPPPTWWMAVGFTAMRPRRKTESQRVAALPTLS